MEKFNVFITLMVLSDNEKSIHKYFINCVISDREVYRGNKRWWCRTTPIKNQNGFILGDRYG
jgi:ribosome biogenesis protein Nip4